MENASKGNEYAIFFSSPSQIHSFETSLKKDLTSPQWPPFIAPKSREKKKPKNEVKKKKSPQRIFSRKISHFCVDGSLTELRKNLIRLDVPRYSVRGSTTSHTHRQLTHAQFEHHNWWSGERVWFNEERFSPSLLLIRFREKQTILEERGELFFWERWQQS